MDKTPVTFEQTYPVPAEVIWKAITDKVQMKEWYFDIKDFTPVVGFEFSFIGKGHKGEEYVHLCRITEVVPYKKFSYTWQYLGLEGASHVCFELFSERGTTRLRLTHEGLETFPPGNPDFAKESFVIGWTYLIGTSLKEFVEKSVN